MVCSLRCVVLLAAGAAACAPELESGEIHLLSYNVAGLPQGISKSNPKTNIPLISPRLSAFDLVVVQEDFNYPDELRKDVTLPHISVPQKTATTKSTFGDGLNRFTRYPFKDFVRTPFTRCFGADCLAAKGISVALTELAPGVEVDVYNLHLEAGGQTEDNEARAEHVEVLLKSITTRSVGRALIVAGDFNLHRKDGGHDVKMLDRLKTEGGLTQVCDALACGDDRVDRVFFRASGALSFAARNWALDTSFKDSKGQELSDHEPLTVKLGWQEREDWPD